MIKTKQDSHQEDYVGPRSWLIATTFLFLTPNVQARGFGWQFDGDQFQAAHNLGEFHALLRQFPDYFNGVDTEIEIRSATVTIGQWSLIGSVCKPDDPRAHTETVAVQVCGQEPGEPYTCQGGTTAPLPAAVTLDPCVND